MNWYPQLQTGAISQFPIKRDRRWRAITNEFESGERLTVTDLGAGSVSWKLAYVELTDLELASIRGLFITARGRYGSFGFVDPLKNLLAGSENLSVADWRMGVMIAGPGITDPLGTSRAWQLTNHGTGPQDLAQTLSFPGAMEACFSIYLRSATAGEVQLRRDSRLSTYEVGPRWKRISLPGTGDTGATTSDFALRLGGGLSVEVWGLQVDAQPYASQYQASESAGGVYQDTSFGMDELRVSSTSPGLSACDVELVSRI